MVCFGLPLRSDLVSSELECPPCSDQGSGGTPPMHIVLPLYQQLHGFASVQDILARILRRFICVGADSYAVDSRSKRDQRCTALCVDIGPPRSRHAHGCSMWSANDPRVIYLRGTAVAKKSRWRNRSRLSETLQLYRPGRWCSSRGLAGARTQDCRKTSRLAGVFASPHHLVKCLVFGLRRARRPGSRPSARISRPPRRSHSCGRHVCT